MTTTLPETIALTLTGTPNPVCHCGAPAFISYSGELYCKPLWHTGRCELGNGAPPDHPAIAKRIGEYNPETRQYPAFVSIDGEPEQCIGHAWAAGAADRLCDEYIFNYYADRHTPEAAARIAVAFAPEQPVDDTPYCFFHPNATDHDTRNCPKLDEPGFGEPSYSVFN